MIGCVGGGCWRWKWRGCDALIDGNSFSELIVALRSLCRAQFSFVICICVDVFAAVLMAPWLWFCEFETVRYGRCALSLGLTTDGRTFLVYFPPVLSLDLRKTKTRTNKNPSPITHHCHFSILSSSILKFIRSQQHRSTLLKLSTFNTHVFVYEYTTYSNWLFGINIKCIHL